MNKMSMLAFSLVVISCWNLRLAEAAEDMDTVEVEIPVNALLAPLSGFEEKNTIEAVLYGVLPNSCYTLGRYQTEQNDANHTIRVRQFASRQTSGLCAEEVTMAEHLKMVVPFTSEVHVGKLPAGDYQFVFNQAGGKLGYRTMNVAPNKTLTVDSLPYALVSSVFATDVVSGADEVVATISGVLNSSCTRLDEKVQIVNQGDVSVLLPTVSVDHGVLCAQALIPFFKKVNIGKSAAGTHLIHVRSMNGKAVNKVIQVLN